MFFSDPKFRLLASISGGFSFGGVLLWLVFCPFFEQSDPLALVPCSFSGPQGPSIPEQFRINRKEDRFPANSNLRDLLAPYGLTAQEIHALIEQTKPRYNLNRVMAGHRYALEFKGGSDLRKLEYEIDEAKVLVVTRDDAGYVSEIKERIFDTSMEQLSCRISDSLWNALISQGETPQLIMNINELMQWDIDFTAIQPDDSVKIIFEKQSYQGEFVRYGEIHALEFRQDGKPFYAFRYVDAQGKPHYYDFNGKGLKKAFLKVPFRYDFRISSGFSSSRLHPVTGKRRPHYGIDYAAPVGTPVLASAGGRVVFAGWSGGGGKTVKIRHSNGVTTYYLHLSQIAVKVGETVSQGERIGAVGATGVVTGPHLDYRIQDARGKFINPKKHVALPADSGLPQERMKDFLAVRDRYLKQLESIPAPNAPPVGAALAG